MTLLKQGLVRGVKWSVLLGLLATYQWWNGNTESVHSMLVYSGMAFFLGLTSVIYEVRRWSFSKQILIHWATMHMTILPLLLLGRGVEVILWQDALRFYMEFNVTGLILFTVSGLLLKIRRQVKAS